MSTMRGIVGGAGLGADLGRACRSWRAGIGVVATAAAVGLPLIAAPPVAAESGTPGPAVASASPAHWWPADGSADDAVGHDNGSLHGVTYGPGGDGTNEAFSFAGLSSNEVLFNAKGGNRGISNFTFSFEILTTSTQHQAIWEKRPVCNADEPFWGFRMLPSGQMNFEVSPGSATELGITSSGSVNNGAWHQVVATRQGRRVTLYIDGVPEASGTAPKYNVNNDARMRAGESACDGVDGTVPFTGELGELMIYRAAVPPS